MYFIKQKMPFIYDIHKRIVLKKMQQKFKLYEKTENKNSSFFTFIYASNYKKKKNILLHCIVVIKFPLNRNKIIYEMYPFVTKPLSSNDFKKLQLLRKIYEILKNDWK